MIYRGRINNTLLICPRDQEQNVKQVVADVKQQVWDEVYLEVIKD
jgi:hypothetical protein